MAEIFGVVRDKGKAITGRLFWPAIARSLYKFQEMGVAKRPMLFRAIGFLLTGLLFGKHEWLWFLLSKFRT